MENMFVPNAVKLTFDLGKHFPADVKAIELKLNGERGL